MPRVVRGKALPKKHVAQMAAAVGTLNFRTSPIGVGQMLDGSRLLLIERRPATVSVKLANGSI